MNDGSLRCDGYSTYFVSLYKRILNSLSVVSHHETIEIEMPSSAVFLYEEECADHLDAQVHLCVWKNLHVLHSTHVLTIGNIFMGPGSGIFISDRRSPD